MPLKDEYPKIDDRRYSDIVAEARTRIPRYTPEWTDVNENEPGMAIVQLFGWMTELLISRLGKVPKLNYLKFLELLGIELIPARPARAEITFPVQPTFAANYVIVPLHTQVETQQPDEQGHSVVFETERALIALTAVLDAVQAYFGLPAFRSDRAIGIRFIAGLRFDLGFSRCGNQSNGLGKNAPFDWTVLCHLWQCGATSGDPAVGVLGRKRLVSAGSSQG